MNPHVLNEHWHLKPARLPFRHSPECLFNLLVMSVAHIRQTVPKGNRLAAGFATRQPKHFGAIGDLSRSSQRQAVSPYTLLQHS